MKAGLNKDIYAVLKKYWGYESFRPLQEDIILSVLKGQDTLALLPTGGGKSLCFQVPSIVLGGTALVITPLISLMNDQVQALKKKGLSAVAISAAMNYKEIDIALNNAAYGHVQFLYVSPERLQNEDFRQKLSHLPITLIAVDEAHCISQWGYDFRPSYLKIAEIREYFNKVNVIALTASAAKEVVADIQVQLKFKNQNVFRQSFVRTNLRYVVQLEENKTERLLKLISNIGGSGIVYLRNRKKTEELAHYFKKSKISSLAYHAGLKFEERTKVQQQWLDNKVQLICATNAFGMGIDKPDVRFVVHLDLPESVEAYFQEAGRAGRDGKAAYATIFYTRADQQRLLDNLKIAFPELEQIRNVYQAICNYFQVAIGTGQGLSVEFDLDKICGSYNLHALIVFNSIKFLEREGYFSFLDGGYEPSKLMMLADKEDIYHFQVRFPKFEPLIKTLLRSYGGLYENYVFINEKELAYRAKIGAATISDYLKYLNNEKLLSYLPQSSLPKLVFLQDRINAKFLQFNPANYNLLKQKQQQRINSVIAYTDTDKICRQVQLLIYFNEIDYNDCGYCDVCVRKKTKDTVVIKNKVIKALSNKKMKLEELTTHFKNYNNQTWVKALNEAVEEGLVFHKSGFYFVK